MTKICVTGGAGFIGSHLAEKLLNLGHNVIVIDNLKTGKRENIEKFLKNKKFEFVKGSILDDKKLDKVMKDVDFVFHEAAKIDIGESVKNPINIYNTNALGTLNVLNFSVKNEIKKIIFASSCAVYGDKKIPVKESTPTNPQNPYAISKIVAESLIKDFHENYGIETVILRYFNIYGPKQSIEMKYAGVIPTFITRALKNKNLLIYGDGKQTRDFTFVKDVVDANILAMKNKKVNEKIFNIGFGKDVSINELAEKIIKLTNSDSKIIHKKSRIFDIKHSKANISLAKKLLRYKPKYDIKWGLKETINWFEK